jgi:hypothetical protein
MEGCNFVSEAKPLPKDFAVNLFPNPFNSSLTISLRGVAAPFGRSGRNAVGILDISGRLIYGVSPGRFCASAQNLATPLSRDIRWTPSPNTPSGIYLVRVRTCDRIIEKPVVYIK